jgi:hypothetical protein
MTAGNKSDLSFLDIFFDIHVLEFAGLEDLAAFLTLDKLRILVASYDLYARMLARLLLVTALRRSGRLWRHKYGRFRKNSRGCLFRWNFRYFRLALCNVKPLLVNLS